MPNNIMPGEHDWMYGVPGMIPGGVDPGVDPRMGFPGATPAQPNLMSKLSAVLGGPQGLLNLGAGLMAAGGPSPQRTSLGQALGVGLLQNQQFKQQQDENALKTLLLKSQIEKARQKQQQQNKTHVVGNALVDDAGNVVYQGQALDNVYGRVNPGDFTPASLAKFEKTKNWSDLERVWAPVNPTVQLVNGVPTVVQPSRTGDPTKVDPLSTLPSELDAARRKAETTAAGAAEGKITGEREGKAPTAYAAYKAGVASLEKAMSGTTTNPVAGRIPAMTAAQQTAEGAQATMAPILKDLFRSSGEGTFTEGDQALLLKMVPTRTDHPEARKAKLGMIDEIVRAKLAIGGGQTAAQGNAPAAAIEHLRKNPQLKEQFKAKYGYVPDGI
jgi:hypothetical protein